MKQELRKALALLLCAVFCLTLALPAAAAEDTQGQTAAKAKVYAAYADFLQMYKTAQDNRFYVGNTTSAEAQKINSELFNLPYAKLYYTLVDLANDGVPELFIATDVNTPLGDTSSGYRVDGYRIYDTYGYAQGQGGRLFDTYSMGYRALYSIMEDGIILCSGSGGAYSHSMIYYGLGTDSLVPQQVCFAEYDGSEGSDKWYSGKNNYNVKQQISGTAYQNLLTSYTYKSNCKWYALGDLSGLREALGLNEITVFVNGKALDCDQAPVIENGRTLVPLRAIFESLGATVDWNAATRSVSSTRGETSIELSIGSKTMYKNGTGIALDVPAQIVGDRTMVPVRAVAEAFGATVVWDSEAREVYITQ